MGVNPRCKPGLESAIPGFMSNNCWVVLKVPWLIHNSQPDVLSLPVVIAILCIDDHANSEHELESPFVNPMLKSEIAP